jgi:molybdopterin-containing oxidoreductase family molybdopterin binding subunit
LKVGALGTALAAAGSAGMFSLNNWLEANAEDSNEERVAYTFHQTHCVGPCSLKCTVRDGRLTLIEPNTWPDDHYSTCCLKGLSEIQHVYSTERIQSPLKRVGERGSGEFVAISWDEALETIETKLKELQDKYGYESIMLVMSGEADMNYPFLPGALRALCTPLVGVDTGCANGYDPAFGTLMVGTPTTEVSDWVNSKTIILVGSNVLESSLADIRWFFEAKEAGAHFVAIDPNYSTTASKANQWIPINQGYDAALLLGMITVIVENKWFDADYLLNNTTLPFLVDTSTGMFLREHESIQSPDGEPEPVEDNPFYVWDEKTLSAVPFNLQDAKIQLEGTFKSDSRNLTTAFSLLRDNCSKYPLVWAAEKSGISEDVIYDLAKRYATGGPACLGFGMGGPDKWANADIVGHAIVLLGALTGNIGRKGGGVGYWIGHGLAYAAELNSWALPDEFVQALPKTPPQAMKYEPNDVKAIVHLGDALRLRFADLNAQKDWLNSLEFIVGIDPYHVPSIDYADIVLPATTRFESRGEFGYVYQARNHVLLQQKIIEPLFDSRTDFEIDLAFAKMFVDEAFLPKSLEELTRFNLDEATDPMLEGITTNTLLQSNCVMKLNVPDAPLTMFEDGVFPSSSGKLELYYENLLTFDQALPKFEEPVEAYTGNSLMSTYPLQFSQPRTKFYIHSQFNDATWIQQFTEPTLEMNPVDAQARNLTNGDIVEAFNDRGSFSCVFKSNPAVRPGSCRSYEGTWPKYFESGEVQNVTNGELNSRGFELWCGPVVPFNDTLVEVRKASVIEGGAA